MKKAAIVISLASLLLSACNNQKKDYDASGSFEAEEVIISAEATGVIKALNIEEGQNINKGELIGYIDSVQQYLKKKQMQAQIDALLSKRPNVPVQLAALQEQLKTAEREQKRISNLVQAEAGTTKQLDDINANIELLKKQIEAQASSLNIGNEGIAKESLPLEIQIAQLNDQLKKCQIINPLDGTVLTKYAEANEMAVSGKAMYKIANLSSINLRVYLSGNQLPQIKLNQTVKVHTDDGSGNFKEVDGTVIWINDKAEFTPKTIQTKDERANMVYAVKIKVKNDGSYKIGMYGEIKFK